MYLYPWSIPAPPVWVSLLYPTRLTFNISSRFRAIILYLGLKGKTPKQVYRDMEATLGEDSPSYSMVKKWVGKFKLGRKSQEDPMPNLDSFPIFKVWKVRNR